MTLRSRDIFSVVPRLEASAGAAAGLAEAHRIDPHSAIGGQPRRVERSGFFAHSGRVSPEPPNSAGKSFSLGKPSRIGSTDSW